MLEGLRTSLLSEPEARNTPTGGCWEIEGCYFKRAGGSQYCNNYYYNDDDCYLTDSKKGGLLIKGLLL